MDHPPKPISLGGVEMTVSRYDERGDVLYLHALRRARAADSVETPEGHLLRYDEHGRLIGATLIGAKAIMARDGTITVTVPRVDAPTFPGSPAAGSTSETQTVEPDLVCV